MVGRADSDCRILSIQASLHIYEKTREEGSFGSLFPI